MEEKVTIMKLKVDLQCGKCYKKIKKVLRKFPQIRDEVYDEKNNVVSIIVVCCSPEKIRDKICCKACGTIKSIEIVEPPPPPKPKPAEKPKEQEKPKEKPLPPPALKPQPPQPIPVYPPTMVVPTGMCYTPCYAGSEPWFNGYGGPPGPGPYCYDGYHGRPVYDSYGGGRPCYVSRCDELYSCEDNNSACTIM